MSSDISIRRQAGWYPDDAEPDRERWWNGTQWTTHTRPAGSTEKSTALVGDLEGQPPIAWSAPDDHRLATVDGAPPRTSQVPVPPDPPDVPPDWYPDPAGLPARRWWDGSAWTEHTAPLGPPPPPGPAWYGPPVVAVAPGKSVAVALVLTFFFGPFGMLYSTVSGALIMLAVLFFGGFLVFGFAWFLLWPLAWAGSMVWGALAAARSGPRPVVAAWR
jgi:hypothetical protein